MFINTIMMKFLLLLVLRKSAGFERDEEDPIYSTPQPNILAWNAGKETFFIFMIPCINTLCNVYVNG